MRRRHFYEDEELDIEDQLDDIDDGNEDISFNPSQIKSIVSSMVSNEVQRLTKETPSTDSHRDTPEEKKEEFPFERDTKSGQSGHPEQQSSPKKPDPKKHTPIPPHSSPSNSTPSHSRKPHHQQKRHRSNNRPTQPGIVRSRPHYNVVYGQLETINNYPNNRNGLVRFNHHFNGNLIICSPVLEEDTPNIQMKKVLWLRRLLIENQYQYLPIYTYDNHRKLIDLSFVIFPKGKMKTDYTDLMRFIDRFLSNLPSHSYIGREDGFYTLYTDHKTIHYTYEDLDSLLDNYSKDRGISLEEGSRHYLNPVPSSMEEKDFRTNLGEICIMKENV